MGLMGKIKEKLKRNKAVLDVYETVFSRFHAAGRKVQKELQILKTRVTVKTHYCFGDKNKGKTFFVISCDGKRMGLYSIIFYMLPFIEYAHKKNYIPMIDLQKSNMPLIQDEDRFGLENPWEYYYEQPGKGYTLDEVYQSRNVIIMKDGAFRIKMPDWNAMCPTTDDELKRWHHMIKLYIRLNKGLAERVEKERERIFKPGRKVLGVGIRAGLRAGMLRNLSHFNGHPVQPTCEELIDIVEGKMKEWGCDSLFVSCDDREYLNKFISYFGGVCYYTERKLLHLFKDDQPLVERAERRIEMDGMTTRGYTEEYILEVYLMAQCNSLYSCRGGGSEFAYFVNGGQYEYLEVYDKGLYTGLGQ